jgi:hypothetical protein
MDECVAEVPCTRKKDPQVGNTTRRRDTRVCLFRCPCKLNGVVLNVRVRNIGAAPFS